MPEIPTNTPNQDLIDEIVNFDSDPLNQHTIPPDDPFHPHYLAKKAQGILTGHKLGMQLLAEDAEAQRQRAIQAEQERDQVVKELRQDEKSKLATESYWRQDLATTIESLGPNDSLLAMVGDLNNFKAVNDSLGHSAGDEMLGIVGQAMMDSFKRKSDHLARGIRELGPEEQRGRIARLGGDEFAIFTVASKNGTNNKRQGDINNPEQQVLNHSKRINDNLKELFKGTKFEEFNVSIALGGAEYEPSLDRSPEDVFVRADAKMYEVKYRGKIENISTDDIQNLRKIIPYIKSLGGRVESWLEQAAFGSETN